MQKIYQKVTTNKKTHIGLALVELLIAIFPIFTLAIETGNLFYYGLFIFLMVDGLRRIIKVFKGLFIKNNVKKQRPKTST